MNHVMSTFSEHLFAFIFIWFFIAPGLFVSMSLLYKILAYQSNVTKVLKVGISVQNRDKRTKSVRITRICTNNPFKIACSTLALIFLKIPRNSMRYGYFYIIM